VACTVLVDSNTQPSQIQCVTAPGTGNNLLVRAQLLRVLAGIACAGSSITLIPYPVVAFLSCLVLTWHLLTWHLLTWHLLTWHLLTWHLLTGIC
jgi:hypothetical protein